MNDAQRRPGVLDLNPELARFQVPATDLCWWCGELATTEEHRFKASTLRRVASSDDGTVEPSNIFKKSSDYEATLKSLKKGTQIRWHKNLCASCNNTRSQPFDRAYDLFETFLVENFDEISSWDRLDWQVIYGSAWTEQVRNLARYFGKQLGCMLATYQLPVPPDLIEFLNGAARCPSVCFMLYINPRAIEAHKTMLQDGFEYGLSKFVGLLDSHAYHSGGEFSGINYGYHIGYLWFVVQWEVDTDFTSWFEYQEIDLPWLSEEA